MEHTMPLLLQSRASRKPVTPCALAWLSALGLSAESWKSRNEWPVARLPFSSKGPNGGIHCLFLFATSPRSTLQLVAAGKMVKAAYFPSAPKTFFNTSVLRATGFCRMRFSSSATILKRPSIAFRVT